MDVYAVREDFPALQRRRFGRPPIYFDNACMTMKPRQVIEAMNRYYQDFPACTGHGRSGHWFASEVAQEWAAARETLRRFVNARSCDEIIFTRNTTEGLNLVAHSFQFKPGDVVLTTDKEHNSNLCPWRNLDARGVISHEVIISNEDNTFDLERLEARLKRGGVRFASFVHASNLDGSAIPAKEAIALCHQYEVLVMLDAAQSAPHKPIDVQDLDADFVAFSVHKMVGPTGTGVLYAKRSLSQSLDCFLVGGDTVSDTYYDQPAIYLDPPERFEAGLQNYAGMIGAGAAADYLMTIGMESIARHECELNRYVTEWLTQHDEIELLGPQDPTLRGGILSFFIKKLGVGDVGQKLDQYGNIMVRTGTFCVHSWFNARRINRQAVPIRASVYLYNTLEECHVFTDTLEEILSEVRSFPSLEVYLDGR